MTSHTIPVVSNEGGNSGDFFLLVWGGIILVLRGEPADAENELKHWSRQTRKALEVHFVNSWRRVHHEDH